MQSLNQSWNVKNSSQLLFFFKIKKLACSFIFYGNASLIFLATLISRPRFQKSVTSGETF